MTDHEGKFLGLRLLTNEIMEEVLNVLLREPAFLFDDWLCTWTIGRGCSLFRSGCSFSISLAGIMLRFCLFGSWLCLRLFLGLLLLFFGTRLAALARFL